MGDKISAAMYRIEKKTKRILDGYELCSVYQIETQTRFFYEDDRSIGLGIDSQIDKIKGRDEADVCFQTIMLNYCTGLNSGWEVLAHYDDGPNIRYIVIADSEAVNSRTNVFPWQLGYCEEFVKTQDWKQEN